MEVGWECGVCFVCFVFCVCVLGVKGLCMFVCVYLCFCVFVFIELYAVEGFLLVFLFPLCIYVWVGVLLILQYLLLTLTIYSANRRSICVHTTKKNNPRSYCVKCFINSTLQVRQVLHVAGHKLFHAPPPWV